MCGVDCRVAILSFLLKKIETSKCFAYLFISSLLIKKKFFYVRPIVSSILMHFSYENSRTTTVFTWNVLISTLGNMVFA